jgi:dihydropteroate synthase
MWNPRILLLESKEQVEAEMAAIGVDPIGVKIMLPKSVFRAVKVEGLRTAAANIIKQEMLSKGGEAAMAWSGSMSSSETTDILLLGTLNHYRRLVQRLRLQPFGLRGLADEIRWALDGFDAIPAPIQCGPLNLEWAQKTYVMGIINVTPDSFSRDGINRDAEAAVAKARQFAAEGADIIDVGGESTRPGHEPVSEEDEIWRVVPAIKAIARSVRVALSVDTSKARVAEAALVAGAHMVNDVWALRRDPQLAHVVAAAQVPVILMHNQEGTHYRNFMSDLLRSLRESIDYACAAGVPEARIIVDPGIGFGKLPAHNLEVMAKLLELRVLGRPILLGPSRKSTIGRVLDLPVEERLEGTAAAVALGIANGVDIVRVHDVREMARVVKMGDAIARGKWHEYS